MANSKNISSAILSDCETYRYRLDRQWSDKPKSCLFIMLNPSTADASKDDPTIRRCIAFAKSWGCGRMTVCNLFAYRATDPRQLKTAPNPVGKNNWRHIFKAAKDTNGPIVFAWGANIPIKYKHIPFKLNRVLYPFFNSNPPTALALTKDGHPRHPLYLSKELYPKPLDVLRREQQSLASR